ncbi:glycerophosphodiester phosphodiesterase family protein [Echinicola sp. 20G]|uniref:glycerophosphodiester phosphodiesterase family protein n=1 Tax=Echinicola sp. 20G TaxID=2781961 RepID=UPI00191033AC|nr:glycerophosphodiester phosphodiesterase family protein [Echinicola sp. 20G]
MIRNFVMVLGVAVCCLMSCHPSEQEQASEVENNGLGEGIAEKLKALKNNDDDRVLIVSHRGDWRNAPENSLQAIQNCIEMKLDMVEIDVRMTKDGHLVLMHDQTIDRTTTGKGKVADWTLDSLKSLQLRNGAGHPTHHKIPTLEEAMNVAKGKILVNLDKAYEIFDQAYEVLEATETTDHVIMKGSVGVEQLKKDFKDYLPKIIYMPIIDLGKDNAATEILKFSKEIKPIAYEVIFSKADSTTYTLMKLIQDNDSKVWVNSLWESLNGGYEDDMAVYNRDSIYGWYLEHKVKLIQTDRPKMLKEYLVEKGKK